MNPFLKFRITTVGGIIVMLIVIGYGFSKSYNLINGVSLTVSGIPTDSIAHNPYLQMSGNAKNAVLLSLNGRPITINKQGVWQDAVILSKGYNMITVLARDKFGKETRKNYQVMLTESI